MDRGIWPEPIAGPDGDLFEYKIPDDGIGRRLLFKKANLPDYENPMDANRDNVYEVTIVLRDTSGARGTKNVRITVNNVDEDGKLELTPEDPDTRDAGDGHPDGPRRGGVHHRPEVVHDRQLGFDHHFQPPTTTETVG